MDNPNVVDASVDQALWTIRQLMWNANPEQFVNIRVIHNKKPEKDPNSGKTLKLTDCLYNKNIQIGRFNDTWEKTLRDMLTQHNTSTNQPCNIYFGINPRDSTATNLKRAISKVHSMYLDLDVTKEYSFQHRQDQIQYFMDCGFTPSLVVCSGHGFQVYWILDTPAEPEKAERILKFLVEKTGTQKGGNTWDRARIFRLPGFMNQKNWYAHDNPMAYLFFPPNWNEVPSVPHYNLEVF